ncbi:DUF2306 domain-containing protein [uncultured Williamsia sp.]|uniref:DUF2306 domain-containing protein n=1 Tax=uncultured Williamsia sp. TaxID=259311 RepID=UPI002621C58F|nr:DUF2306 domain-containing protein [uncultured Williamsia sp.]
MSPVVAVHAVCATLALLLGPVVLLRRPRGDTAHRWLGRIWVGVMYVALATSMFIEQLRPGHLSFFHALTAFTTITISVGLWAAVRGRVEMHRRFMRNSWFGVVGAFTGAVAVPSRDVPQLATHDPILFTTAVVGLVGGCVALVVAVEVVARRRWTTRPSHAMTSVGSG